QGAGTLGVFGAGAGLACSLAGADAGPAAECVASAAAVAAARHADTQFARCCWRGADCGTQAWRPVAGTADPAAVYPGVDSRQRCIAGGLARLACGRSSAMAGQPDCVGGYPDTLCDRRWAEDQRR